MPVKKFGMSMGVRAAADAAYRRWPLVTASHGSRRRGAHLPSSLSSSSSNAPMRGVLQRIMTHADVSASTATGTEDALLTPWPQLTSLYFFDDDTYGLTRNDHEAGITWLATLLELFGPQLHTLHIDMGEIEADGEMIDWVCPAIARCGNLKSFMLNHFNYDVSGPLCDALLASGAPLEDVTSLELARDDAVRLIEATETIHTAHVWDLELADLSPRALGRMRMLNECDITNEVESPKQP